MAEAESSAGTASREKTALQAFAWRERLLLWLVTWVGFAAVRLIGPTLRWTVSVEEGGLAPEQAHPVIHVFWHRAVFPATWFWRNRGIAVMTSSSFDGEYIARIIEKCGYRAVRGSSSRGAVRALLGMHTEIEQGRSVAFTIDGPRGPVYVAKPGPVLLARNTGVPIHCFYIALDKAWVMNSWDRFMIPKPFSRAVLRIGKAIRVPADCDSVAHERFQAEMQATLERITRFAEEEVHG